MYVTFVVAVVFVYIVMSDGVIGMQYVDHDGKHYPVGVSFLSQVIVILIGIMMKKKALGLRALVVTFTTVSFLSQVIVILIGY